LTRDPQEAEWPKYKTMRRRIKDIFDASQLPNQLEARDVISTLESSRSLHKMQLCCRSVLL